MVAQVSPKGRPAGSRRLCCPRAASITRRRFSRAMCIPLRSLHSRNSVPFAAMTFRTPKEAVVSWRTTRSMASPHACGERERQCRAACGRVQGWVVWVNCTNLFDAACGFGGYRESGYGREGGREGLLEYMEPTWFKHAPALPTANVPAAAQVEERLEASTPSIDRTVKLYIGGKAGASRLRLQPGSALTRWTAVGRSSCRKPQGHSQRRRGRAQGQCLGEAPRRTTVLRFCITARKTSPSTDRDHPQADSVRPSARSKLGGSRTGYRAYFFLRGLGRQVRWRRS